jgi:cytochrome P450
MPEHPAADPYLEILAAEDPAPIVHRLRAEDPVHYVPAFSFWFITRHDDVKPSRTAPPISAISNAISRPAGAWP